MEKYNKIAKKSLLDSDVEHKRNIIAQTRQEIFNV